MAYSKVLFMSYVVPTFYPAPPGAVAAASGAPAVTLSDPDLQARAQRFLNVLYWAQQQFGSKTGMTDPATLKLFVAPEFYFRKATSAEVAARSFALDTFYGSYPENARYELAEALYGALHGQAAFQDWTVVAGTLCSMLPPAPPRYDLLNTAIMLRGKRTSTDDAPPYVLMEKHYISNIDGPPAAWHANLNPTSVFSFALNPDQSLDNLIRWDGMTTGLEVCLDHSMGVLTDALTRLRTVLGPSAPRFDLQVVTSCGMDVVTQHVAVKDGALIVLTDGYASPLTGFATPITRQGRYSSQSGAVSVQYVTPPAITALPATPDYTVTCPGYAGTQGVYAFDVQALGQG